MHLTYLPKLNSEIMKIAKTGIIKKKNASRNIVKNYKKNKFSLTTLSVIFFTT